MAMAATLFIVLALALLVATLALSIASRDGKRAEFRASNGSLGSGVASFGVSAALTWLVALALAGAVFATAAPGQLEAFDDELAAASAGTPVGTPAPAVTPGGAHAAPGGTASGKEADSRAGGDPVGAASGTTDSRWLAPGWALVCLALFIGFHGRNPDGPLRLGVDFHWGGFGADDEGWSLPADTVFVVGLALLALTLLAVALRST